MSILDNLISFVAPLDCLGCGYEGGILCDTCFGRLSEPPAGCYRCRKSSTAQSACDDCLREVGLSYVRVVSAYDDLAKDLVLHLKYHSTWAATATMARAMAPLAQATSNAIILPLPTASSRARKRGYDQAKLLARALSRHQGVSYLDCLRRVGQSHQVGANRAQRLAQLREAFQLKKPELVKGKNIILIDDVITTGATIEAAAAVIKKADAQSVSAITFAQA